MRTQPRFWILWMLVLGVSSGCSSSEGPATYHGQVRALMERSCVSCHNDQGIAPFSLEGFANAQRYGEAALGEVEAGTMPPWLPSDECRSYKAERGLSHAEQRALRDWVQGGMPEGLPEEYKAPDVEPDPREQLGPATLDLGFADAYAPSTEHHDDYHCFVLDLEGALKEAEGDGYASDKERYLRMLDVVPGNADIVHHVIVFLIPEAQSSELEVLDAEEEGPGYTCFGGAGIGTAKFLGGWVPGSVPQPWDAQSAQRLPARSRLVMQVHYHDADGAQDPATHAKLWVSPDKPTNIIDVEPVANQDLSIQPGDAESYQKALFPMLGWPGEIVATFPHMHLLGSQIRSAVLPSGDSAEACLVDIPRWDFNWQQQYNFLDDEGVYARIGDAIRLECIYDNSAGNQPVVDGKSIEPREVHWGEGTLDEMCLNVISIRRPYFEAPSATSTCGDYTALYRECRSYAEPSRCAIGAAGASADVPACVSCVMPKLITCLASECPVQMIGLQACAQEHGTINALAACSEQFDQLDACGGDFLDQGGCNAELEEACGVSLGFSE